MARLSDLTGRQLITVPLTGNQTTMSTAALAPGCYILTIITTSGSHGKVFKVLKLN
jgi:hypothetical protein